jgi:hypothetical protein
VNRWARVLVLFGGGAAVALGAEIAQPGTRWSALALIGGAIAAGELITLRPPFRQAIPISFAFMVVLARRATLGEAALVLVVSLLATFLVRNEPSTVEGRIALFVERFVEGMSAALVYRGMREVFGIPMSRAQLLCALAFAAMAPLAVAEIARMVRDRSISFPMSGRAADVALVTSATLMAVSDLGVQGHGGMGLWGPAVFTIPLLAAWYSYEHLEIIRRTYDQTIHALGAAPELGGMVRDGHAERVADLCVAMANELGFSRHELEQLETAALLHHLGQVCLDEPDDGRAPEAVAIAQAGATVLRGTRLLAPSGDIIAAETMPFREKISSRPSVMSGQILKVASAFDELGEGRPQRAAGALEALYSCPGYLYDTRVLAALEVVLDRRGLLGDAGTRFAR